MTAPIHHPKYLLIYLLFALSSIQLMATEAQDIQTLTLNNGMKILVLTDNSIPNANMYLFYRVGSRNEQPGTTGLSHFFEHMMFNGAKKYGPKMFDRTMEAAGGANNAYTTENLTVYTDWFPSGSLELIFDLEADRIAHLNLDPKMVESERGVVISERSTSLENSNFTVLQEEVKAAAFRAHPYSWPIIGHLSDIENWSITDLQDFYKTYYAPNNAIVVIVGDVEFEQVKTLAKQYFEPIPSQPTPRKVHTVEPKQTGERRVTVHKASISSDNILFAYHVPQTNSEDFYPLTLLVSILTEGKSSRLSKALVDTQIATDVFGYMPESFDPNLVYFYAIATKTATAPDMEKAIIAELNQIIKQGVTAKELLKAQNNKTVEFHRNMATINGKADTIGTYATFFGDYTQLFNATTKYQQVTNEDIKRVANRYLRKANRTVGILSAQEDSHEQDL